MELSFNPARQLFPEEQNRSSREVYTYSTEGKKIYPLDPYYCINDIKLEDIALTLSLSFKYNCLTRRPYSMAEHSIHLANLVWSLSSDPEQARLALLSTSDTMAFTQRSILQFNTPAEMALERMTWVEAVWSKFADLEIVDATLLQRARKIVLMAERLDLIQVTDAEDQMLPDPSDNELNEQIITVRGWMEAGMGSHFWKQRFLNLYSELTHDIGDGIVVEK